jgi:hypothetical protein
VLEHAIAHPGIEVGSAGQVAAAFTSGAG